MWLVVKYKKNLKKKPVIIANGASDKISGSKVPE